MKCCVSSVKFLVNFGLILDVIDDFIAYADLDQNGLLTYPEYMKAISTDDWNTKVDTTETPPPDSG